MRFGAANRDPAAFDRRVCRFESGPRGRGHVALDAGDVRAPRMVGGSLINARRPALASRGQ
jgi:hypothetical protein